MALTRLPIIFALAAALIIVLAAGPSAAQSSRSEAIDGARTTYNDIRTTLENGGIKNPREIEDQLRALRSDSRLRLAAIERELASVRSQLEPLGPAPGEGEPPESEDLAAQRSTLNQEIIRLNSEKTRVNANIFEANDLLSRISASQLQNLYAQLFERGASPLLPTVWNPALQSLGDVANRIGIYFDSWGEKKRSGGAFVPALGFIFVAFVISILLFGPVDKWIMSTFSAVIEKRKPSPARRVVVAGLKMIARTAPGLIGGFIIIETLRAQAILTEQGEGPTQALWFALIAFLLVSGFTRGLFAPANPDWRIAPVDAKRGRMISTLMIAVVIVFGTKMLLVEILAAAKGVPELIILIKALGAIIVALLLYRLCITRLWRDEPAGDEQNENSNGAEGGNLWRAARRIGRALSIVIVVAAITGYVAFADFVVSRIYFLAIFLALAWFVRAILSETALWMRQRTRDDARSARSQEEAEIGAANFLFWTTLLINIALFFALLPAVFVLFGVPAATVADMTSQALFGFDVGRVHIPSIANLLLALLIFVGIMLLTKVAQRGFQRGVFAHSHVDQGVQNSLTTLMGYAGLLVALFAAVSAIGFDLSNLALIAGALSVGIGFGLQSIVNNFVSGLILLFERPIKVGDWIVTASGEGTVRRISVRSTEIVTFDRSSIIVPNSELISSTVTNWTHKDKIGRITVPVGVSYSADPEMVRTILLKCAEDHALVVKYPEAFVVWQDFGASSLDFELRAYLGDISSGLKVRSELRFSIFKALAEADIEIPFPQRDVHVKSWPAERLPKATMQPDVDA